MHHLEYIYAEVMWQHHNDLGMNTTWSGLYFCLFSTFPILVLLTFVFHVPLPMNPLEVYTNKEEMWNNISECGKGQVQEHPHLISICMLAPTLPCTQVSGVGWSNCDPTGGAP